MARTSLAESGGKLDKVEKGGISTQPLHELLEVDKRIPLEASGVTLAEHSEGGAQWSVVFDNFTAIGALPVAEDRISGVGTLTVESEDDVGYEGVTFDTLTGEYFTVVEGVERKKRVEPEIHVYDRDWKLLREEQVDFELDDVNKGMEGLAHVYHEGERYLLMLCESNDCSSKGKRGEGRIHAFVLDDDEWQHADTIKLPEELEFSDYSGLDVRGDRIVVTSQEESALWIGRLVLEVREDGSPDWSIDGEGEVYDLPRKSGKIHYCNVEGVSFLGEDQLVLVSDRHKPDQPNRCEDTDQALHVVVLP